MKEKKRAQPELRYFFFAQMSERPILRIYDAPIRERFLASVKIAGIKSRSSGCPLFSKRMHCPIPVLTRKNVEDLTRYSWPGNIRELQNVIERAVILARGGPLHFTLNETTDSGTAAIKQTPTVSTRAQLLELERTS